MSTNFYWLDDDNEHGRVLSDVHVGKRSAFGEGLIRFTYALAPETVRSRCEKHLDEFIVYGTGDLTGREFLKMLDSVQETDLTMVGQKFS